MIYPKFIKEGSTIGIPAPSSGAWDEFKKIKFANAKKNLENLGFKIIQSKNINTCEKYRSADAVTRANEINEMFERKDIDAIMCATGGEFLVEILPYIDFNKIAENPKWIQGFSDPTGLLIPITTKYDIATIYGNNYSTYGTEHLGKSALDSIEILKGNIVKQTSYEFYEEESLEHVTGIEDDNLTEKVEWKILNNENCVEGDNSIDTDSTASKPTVEVKGRVLAGCFDLISELAGTKYDGIPEFAEKYKDDGIIYCFDNCEISLEEVIRTLWKFNELGYFKYAKAVIFGRNGGGVNSAIYTMEECLKDSVLANLNIPIIFDADVSHKSPCLNLINGAIATFYVSGGKAKINFELK